MTHEHADGVTLRLAHRFDSGYWVRCAATSKTLGTIYRNALHDGPWHWNLWGHFNGCNPSGSERTRRAACAALVTWYREHDPDALTATPTTTTEVTA